MTSTHRILLSIPHMNGHEEGYVRQAFATNWLSTLGEEDSPQRTRRAQRKKGLVNCPDGGIHRRGHRGHREGEENRRVNSVISVTRW